jgi:hypothetical protein
MKFRSFDQMLKHYEIFSIDVYKLNLQHIFMLFNVIIFISTLITNSVNNNY